MTRSLLNHYRGAAVELRINDLPALGVLCLSQGGTAFVSSLCYTQGVQECPMFSYMLTENDIEAMTCERPGHLLSAVALHHGQSVPDAGEAHTVISQAERCLG